MKVIIDSQVLRASILKALDERTEYLRISFDDAYFSTLDGIVDLKCELQYKDKQYEIPFYPKKWRLLAGSLKHVEHQPITLNLHTDGEISFSCIF